MSKGHPDADRIEKAARALVSSYGRDPDESVGHGWYEDWNPHEEALPQHSNGFIPGSILYHPQWTLHTREALRHLIVLDAIGVTERRT